jgi:hypothetical protein
MSLCRVPEPCRHFRVSQEPTRCGSAHTSSFYKQDTVWKHINLLRILRNHFMHYKLEWQTSASRGHLMPQHRATRRLAHELRELSFDNPLFRATGGIPLEGFLGAKCAKWAITTSLLFADKYAADSKIELYQEVRKLISDCTT